MLSARSLPLVLGHAALVVVVGCSARGADTRADRVTSSNDAIINGTASSTAQDGVVLLDFPAGRCSGSLVAKNLVLSARHCVGKVDDSDQSVVNFAASDIKVYAGSRAVSKANGQATPAARGKKLFTTGSNMIPDISLIVLDQEVDAPVVPIRLDGGATVGEGLTIVGYGLDENSQIPTQRLQRTGKSVVRVFPDAMPSGWAPLNDGEFTFSEAACSGDSGGPALGEGSGAVIGVASRVGNGQQVDSSDRAAFCRGEDTINIYTSLAPVKELVMAAFEAAGASPTLEGAKDTGTSESTDAPDENGTTDKGTTDKGTTEDPTTDPGTDADAKNSPQDKDAPDEATNAEDPAPETTTPRAPRKSKTKTAPSESDPTTDSPAAPQIASAGCSVGAPSGSLGDAPWGLGLAVLAMTRLRRRRAAR